MRTMHAHAQGRRLMHTLPDSIWASQCLTEGDSITPDPEAEENEKFTGNEPSGMELKHEWKATDAPECPTLQVRLRADIDPNGPCNGFHSILDRGHKASGVAWIQWNKGDWRLRPVKNTGSLYGPVLGGRGLSPPLGIEDSVISNVGNGLYSLFGTARILFGIQATTPVPVSGRPVWPRRLSYRTKRILRGASMGCLHSAAIGSRQNNAYPLQRPSRGARRGVGAGTLCVPAGLPCPATPGIASAHHA